MGDNQERTPVRVDAGATFKEAVFLVLRNTQCLYTLQ